MVYYCRNGIFERQEVSVGIRIIQYVFSQNIRKTCFEFSERKSAENTGKMLDQRKINFYIVKIVTSLRGCKNLYMCENVI